MSASLPFGGVSLFGWAIMRGVTLALPITDVLALLPDGMRLRPQELTPPGTHPVLLLFHDIVGARMTIPTLLPRMTYFEHIVGVPFVEALGDALHEVPDVPFCFLPQLLLTNDLAVLGGRLYWGFTKDLARIVVAEGRYEVWSLDGRPLVALEFQPATDWHPVTRYPHFDALRPTLDQPLVSQLPLGLGPFVAGSRFERDWATAQMRGISTAVHVVEPYVPGLSARRHPSSGWAPSIQESVLGSYEIAGWWNQTLSYPTWII